MRKPLALLLLCVLPVAQTFAEEPLRVRRIVVKIKEIFDVSNPKENRWPFTWGNALHLRTKESVIDREILLKPGDIMDPLLLVESERNLRQFEFLKNAVIEPVMVPGTKLVDLVVTTQDTWTTQPQASWGSEGGVNTYSFGFLEKNLLGYGKTISVFSGKDKDRKTNEFGYEDPRVFGSRFKFDTLLSKNDDGSEVNLVLDRPFYSLTTPSATSLIAARNIQENRLFQDGEETSVFRADHRVYSATYGATVKRNWDWTHRLQGGYSYNEDRFTPLSGTTPGTLPESRKFSGPQISYTWLEAQFVKDRFLEKMERIEDLNLGYQGKCSVGYGPESFGSDRDTVIVNVEQQTGSQFGQGRYFLANVGLATRRRRETWGNTIAFSNANLLIKSEEPWLNTWAFHAEAAGSARLDGENQFELGGDTGLRGYKIRAFTGSQSFLFNAENRFFYPKEIWNLAYFGGAVFFDSGLAVPEGTGAGWRQFKSDVGFGLRIGPTRSSNGEVVRLDLAYALNDPPGNDTRWVVSLKAAQAFDPFNNTFGHLLSGFVSSLKGISPNQRSRSQ